MPIFPAPTPAWNSAQAVAVRCKPSRRRLALVSACGRAHSPRARLCARVLADVHIRSPRSPRLSRGKFSSAAASIYKPRSQTFSLGSAPSPAPVSFQDRGVLSFLETRRAQTLAASFEKSTSKLQRTSSSVTENSGKLQRLAGRGRSLVTKSSVPATVLDQKGKSRTPAH